jgi:hypothetical protein
VNTHREAGGVTRAHGWCSQSRRGKEAASAPSHLGGPQPRAGLAHRGLQVRVAWDRSRHPPNTGAWAQCHLSPRAPCPLPDAGPNSLSDAVHDHRAKLGLGRQQAGSARETAPQSSPQPAPWALEGTVLCVLPGLPELPDRLDSLCPSTHSGLTPLPGLTWPTTC